MPLFFFSWKDDAGGDARASLLVDERDAARAGKIAHAHHGATPDAMQELPAGVFAAEVLFYPNDELDEDEVEELTEEDVEAGDTVAVEVLPHVDGALRLLEDATARAIEALKPSPIEVSGHCNGEGEDDRGNVLYCELAAHGSDSKHVGGGFTW